MWFRKRHASTSGEAPSGVRIRRLDGSAIECRMLRDADQDVDGCAAWLAVPLERVAIMPGDSLEADAVPPHTAIVLDLPLG
jgi:hypothetical protein